MDFIKSLLVWFFGMLLVVGLFFPAFMLWILTVLFDRRMYILHMYSCFWGSTFTWLSPFWKVRIQNRHKITPDKTYVLVSNHQSLLDILVLYRIFVHFKWVAKKELFRIPFVGWNMLMNRYVSIERGKPASVKKMISISKEHLKRGSSLMIFPEGTRSEDTNMKKFKDGAFKLAIETGTPIIPMVLDGTGNALPKKGFIFRGAHRIVVDIMDEIPADSYQGLDPPALSALVRENMKRHLQKIRPYQ